MQRWVKNYDIFSIEKVYIDQGLEYMKNTVMKTKKYKTSTQYTLTLNDEIYLLLQALALKNKISISKIIYMILEEKCEKDFLDSLVYAAIKIKEASKKNTDIEYLE